MEKIPKTGGVYVLRNQIAKRLYVGSSVNLRTRASMWTYRLKSLHKNLTPAVIKDCQLHGPESFEFVIIKLYPDYDQSALEIEEAEVIARVHAKNFEVTYNVFHPVDGSHYYRINGVVKSLSEWRDKAGVRIETFKDRRKAGWSIERAATTPPKKAA